MTASFDDPEGKAERLSTRGLLRLGARLSDRDWEIIRFLASHRYATTRHLRRAFFTTHASPAAATRATVRVLDRLLVHRVLSRLDRAVGGPRRGSAAYTWRLGHIGERLLQSAPGEPRKRLLEPSLPFLAHALALTELHVQLIEADAANELSLVAVEVERDAWRGYVTAAGARAVMQPDLMVTSVIQTREGDFEDHWYIEVDLGTESLPVLLRKCQAYETYRRTGRAQAEHGDVFPRVLWLMHRPDRAKRLYTAIDGDSRLTNEVFLVTTFDRAVAAIRGHPEPPNPEAHQPAPKEGGTP